MTKIADKFDRLAEHTAALPDEALEIEWAWGSYKDEGVRFAFLRLIETLEALRVQLRSDGARISQARALLGSYHRAYRELDAILWGLDDEQTRRRPAEGEWSVRKTLAHIVGGDIGFHGVIAFALEGHRGGAWSEARSMEDADWDRISGLSEEAYTALLDRSAEGLRAFHRSLHDRVMQEFSEITDAELDLPARYWEDELLPIRFRLGRFASHLRQHTVQIEKTLLATGAAPGEIRRLLRLAFASAAEVELVNPKIGPDDAPEVSALIDAIIERTGAKNAG